jgi:hypothetical protein
VLACSFRKESAFPILFPSLSYICHLPFLSYHHPLVESFRFISSRLVRRGSGSFIEHLETSEKCRVKQDHIDTLTLVVLTIGH